MDVTTKKASEESSWKINRSDQPQKNENMTRTTGIQQHKLHLTTPRDTRQVPGNNHVVSCISTFGGTGLLPPGDVSVLH